MRDLTNEEQLLLNKLGKCASEAADLKQLHPSDLPDFVAAVNQAQNIILARPAFEFQVARYNQSRRAK